LQLLRIRHAFRPALALAGTETVRSLIGLAGGLDRTARAQRLTWTGKANCNMSGDAGNLRDAVMRFLPLVCALALSAIPICGTSAADTAKSGQTTDASVPARAADGLFSIGSNMDVNALVQWVLRESYLQTTEDLRSYAEKVKYFNTCKKLVRDALKSLRDYLLRSHQSCVDKRAAADVKEICDGIGKLQKREREVDAAQRKLPKADSDRDED
jgi:hypothetical protein